MQSGIGAKTGFVLLTIFLAAPGACLTNGKFRGGNQTPVNTGLASSGFVVPLRRITAVTRSRLYPVVGCLAEQVVDSGHSLLSQSEVAGAFCDLARGTTKRDRTDPVFHLCGIRGPRIGRARVPDRGSFRDPKEKDRPSSEASAARRIPLHCCL